MYKNKKEVDIHVRSAISKLRSETERQLRSHTIAKLYYKINEYETAVQYLLSHLIAKEDNDQAHKLLGQCYLRLNQPKKALESFQRSLQLNPKQQEILVEVCQLLLKEKSLNLNTAKYWCDLAESEKVQHDSILSLRLSIMHQKNNDSNQQIDELLQKEIRARPNDVQLRVRLIHSYIEQQKIYDAFKYIWNVEMDFNDAFLSNGEWYNIVWLVLNKYEQLPNAKMEWEFWLLLITCLERQVYFSFCMSNNTSGSVTETANLLFNLDQYLLKVTNTSDKFCIPKELVTIFLDHFRGQLLLHATALIFKREVLQNKNKWKESVKIALPLLLLAYQVDAPDNKELWLKHCDEYGKQLLQLWSREGAFRCAQAGRTLLSCIMDENSDKENAIRQTNIVFNDQSILWINADDLLSQIRTICSDKQWRHNVFIQLFCNSDQKVKEQTSLLIKSSKHFEPIFELPRYADIERYEELAQYLAPKSLQHIVYLTLGNENLSDVRARYFNGLMFSTPNLSFCGVESLNQLDVEGFLYAATIEAKRVLEVERETINNFNVGKNNIGGKPRILPFVILKDKLCSKEQISWWLAVYEYYKNLINENLGEIRSTIQFGIEAVRGISGPKVDMIIVFKLGEIFVKRARNSVKTIEKGFLEARAESIYKCGLNMLKMHNKSVLEPYQKFFKYAKSNTSAINRLVVTAAEEAVSYLADSYFKKSEYEELIDELTGIEIPYAAYLQSEAYRKLDEASKTPRQAKRMYLDRSIDCLQKTLILLKSNQIEHNHPLNAVVHSELKRLQNSKLNNDNYGSSYGMNNSSTYEDAESDLFADTLNNSVLNRSRREIAAAALLASPRNTELENLVKQMAETLSFLKEEIVETIKPEVQSMRKEMGCLKDKIANLEEAMKKTRISSNPPSRDDASNVLDDFYLIEDALQNQMYNNQTVQQPGGNIPTVAGNIFPNATNCQTGNIHSPLFAHQPRIQTPNALHNIQQNAAAAAAVAAYNNPMFNHMNYYAQSQYMGAGGTGNTLLGQRNPLPLSFMDTTGGLTFNIPPNTSLLPPPPPSSSAQQNQDGRTNNLYGLISQNTPQLPVSISLPPSLTLTPSVTSNANNATVSITSASSTGTSSTFNTNPVQSIPQFNKLFNNQPVEKGPPANVVITSSDPLPNRNYKPLQTQQPTLSVTIPPHHIKTSLVQTPDAVTPPAIAVTQAPTFNGFNLNVNTPVVSTPFTGFGLSTTNSTTSFSSIFDRSNIKPTIDTTKTNSSTTFSFGTLVNKSIENSNDGLSTNEINERNEQEIEYDPRPDFQPIIPLPNEIVVKTGEEDEEVVFSHRAKLFRFIINEWKERGVGDIKILKNKDGQYRILMRRDQVHKICANHKITKQIIMQPVKKESKALIWAANDFADEELRLEKFIVRFKLEETAKQFLKAFQEAQKATENLPETEIDLKEMKPPATLKAEDKNKKVTPTQVPSFGLAKSSITNFVTSTPATKSENIPSVLSSEQQQVTSANTTLSFTTSTAASKSLFSGFNLESVNVKSENKADNTKPTAGATPSPFANFSFSASSAFATKSTSITTITTTTATNSASPFANIGKTIGSPFVLPAFAKTTETAVMSTPTTPFTSTVSQAVNSTINNSSTLDNEDDYEPTATYDPVIPLPDLINASTGEENEKVLFEHRAKLLRFNKASGEWKERGIGNMKILQDLDDASKVRLIMRREQIHKLCCNQFLQKDTSFKYAKNSKTALMWAGQDYSENELVTEMMTVRFKTAEICTKFYDTILKAQENMKANKDNHDIKSMEIKENEEKPKGFGDAFKPKVGSWSCDACYISNKAEDLYCVACQSPKDNTVPKKTDNLLLNNSSNTKTTFSFGFPGSSLSSTTINSNVNKPAFSFEDVGVTKKENIENKESGNSTSTSIIQSTTIAATPTNFSVAEVKIPLITSGFGDKFKPKAGSWSCSSCYLSNPADLIYCKACNEPKDSSVPKKENNEGVLDLKMPTTKFTFGFGAASAAAKTTTTTVAEAVVSLPTSTSANSKIEDSLKFTFSMPNTTTAAQDVTTKDVTKSFSFPFFTSNSTTSTPMTLGKPTFTFSMPTANKVGASGSAVGAGGENSVVPFSLDKKDFNFTLKPKSPGKSGKSPLKFGGGGDNGDDDDEVNDYQEEENNTYFTPVIPLPDKIDVKTGEEDEELLYVHRAKLYRFADGEWKERGLGDVKILRHKETNKLRVVMRREQILKICLNHVLNENVDYIEKDEKTWLFVVNDFSEGTLELEKFSLRFKTKDISQRFMDSIKSAIDGTAKPILPSVVNNSLNVSAPESSFNISEADRKTADNLKLPYEFFALKISCTGCRGCDSENFEFSSSASNEVFISQEDALLPLLPLEMPEIKPLKQKSTSIKQSILSPPVVKLPSINKSEKNIFSGFGNSKITEEENSNPDKPSGITFSFNATMKSLENKNDTKSTEKEGFVFGSSNFGGGKPVFGQTSGSIFGVDVMKTKSADNKNEKKSIFDGSFSDSNSLAINGSTSIFGGNSSVDVGNNLFSKPLFVSSALGGTSVFGDGATSIFGNTNKKETNAADKLFISTTNKDNVKNETAISVTNFAELSEKSGAVDFATLANKANTTGFAFGGSSLDDNSNKKNEKSPTPLTFAELSQKNNVDFASLAKANLNTDLKSKEKSSTHQFIGLTNQDAFSNFMSPQNKNATTPSKATDKNGDYSLENENKNESENENENDTYDPYYEPLIPLPNEIVHSTGEQDETKLFGERAKLYRYDNKTKEWKERGIGEMKILQHNNLKTYRIVLRREQIFKLVLNQSIHANFAYSHMNNDLKSFCWGGLNFAESEEGVLEKLAVRFKNADIAEAFSKKLQECIDDEKNRNTDK